MISLQQPLSVPVPAYRLSFQASARLEAGRRTTQSSQPKETTDFRLRTLTEARLSLGDQNALFHFNQLSDKEKSQLVYNGAPISGLSSQEAADLISEDGYFGVAKTSQRIADFVIKATGEDLELLRAGREGVLQGFAKAEKAWGGELPEICYDTLAKTLESIDARIQELGGAVLDITG